MTMLGFAPRLSTAQNVCIVMSIFVTPKKAKTTFARIVTQNLRCFDMRSKLAKVIVWRFISIFVTLCILSLVTGNIGAATGITLFLHALLTLCHYGFESFWEKYAADCDNPVQ